MKKVLIIILCVLIIAGGGFLVFSKISGLKYAHDVMDSCSVSTGGGMLGGHWSSYLRREKDGTATLTVASREYHSAREVSTVYQVDPAAFDHLAELVNEYGLYAASKRPMSEFQALDADTTRIAFSYSKGSFDISEEQSLTKKMSEGFREVQAYLASLANGEGVTTVEPQTAMLYLKSGYTLQFIVEEEFDGRMDEIFMEDREVSRYQESGIILCEGEKIDVTGAAPVDKAAAGAIVYNAETGSVIILYKDCEFGQEVYQVAQIDGYISSAAPLIEEMEGPYRLQLN